jgi:hypothetical protein
MVPAALLCSTAEKETVEEFHLFFILFERFVHIDQDVTLPSP